MCLVIGPLFEHRYRLGQAVARRAQIVQYLRERTGHLDANEKSERNETNLVG